MKNKYFSLSELIQIKRFTDLEKPMGWLRLNKDNIKLKKSVLTKKELKHLNEEVEDGE